MLGCVARHGHIRTEPFLVGLPQNSLEEINSDEGLACASSQSQKRAFLSASDLFKDGSNRRILIIAARGFSARIRNEQWPSRF